MFISSKKELRNHRQCDDSVYIPKVALPCKTPIFLCEVDEFEANREEPVCSSQYLVSDVEHLSTFAESNKISSTYLVSPGYLNQTGEWSLNKLMAISRAEYVNENCSSYVYRFEFEQGTSMDHDISGLNKNRNELTFKSILNFKENET